MGSFGNSLRKTVRSLISNPNIRSLMTLVPITRTIGTSGGFGAVTEAQGNSRTIYGVPTMFIADRIEMLKLGDVKSGEVSMFIRDDETLDTDDKITLEGKSYNIRNIENVYLNEVIIGREVILSEDLE